MFKARLVTAAIALAVSLVIAVPALAMPIPQFSYEGIVVSSCTPGQPVTTRASFNVGAGDELRVEFRLNNPRAGTTNGMGMLIVSGPSSGSLDFSYNSVPAGTLPDDTLVQNVQVRLNTVLVETLDYAFNCSTGQPPAVWEPRMSPLPDSLAAPFLAIAAAGGRLPCAVFDVGGHGAKIVLMSDFPSCTAEGYTAADLTVYCLDSSRRWTDREVHDLTAKPDGTELSFISGQHGVCGLFPIP